MTEQEWTDFKAKIAGHTPGPWLAEPTQIGRYGDSDAPGSHDYYLYSPRRGAVGYWTGHKDSHVTERWFLTEQDAALIAAAPTLVAEVERLREALAFYADYPPHQNPNNGPWGVDSTDFGSVARTALTGSSQ